MSVASEPLQSYAEILGISRHMLSSAEAGQWDDLAIQEAARLEIVDRLKKRNALASSVPGAEEQAKINALIREILALDEQTRALAERRLGDIRESLAAAGVSRQLNNTYLRP